MPWREGHAPELLFPKKGRYGLSDYEKAFCSVDDAKLNIYAMRSVNKEAGCLVVVRPDQYVAQVMPLSEHAALTNFFASFMLMAPSPSDTAAHQSHSQN